MNKKHLIGLFACVSLSLSLSGFAVGQNSKPASSASSASSTSSEKGQLAVELFGETANLFPAEVVEEVFTEVIDQAVSQMKTEIAAGIGAKVDENKAYTPQRKAAIKAKLPEFAESIGEATRGIFTESFTVRDWVGTASMKNFEKKFTVVELKQLIATFQSPEGREFVTLFNQTVSAGLKEKNTNLKLKGNPQVIAEFDRFAETPLGKKFFNVLIKDIYTDVSKEAETWSKNSAKKLGKEMENGELHRLIVEFAEQNLQ